MLILAIRHSIRNGIHSKEADEKLKNILTPEKAEESAAAKVTDGEKSKSGCCGAPTLTRYQQ